VLFSHFFYFRSCTWIPVVALRVVLYDTMHSAQSQPRCFSKSHHLSSQSTPGPAPCVGVSPGRAHCCPSIITIRRCGPYHIPTCCEMTRTTTIWSNSTLRTRARSATSMRSNVGERPEAVEEGSSEGGRGDRTNVGYDICLGTSLRTLMPSPQPGVPKVAQVGPSIATSAPFKTSESSTGSGLIRKPATYFFALVRARTSEKVDKSTSNLESKKS